MRGFHYSKERGTVLCSVGIDEAAERLALDVPSKSAAQWKAWLYNNMKPSRRVSYRVPYGKLFGKLNFHLADLDRVVSIERARAGLSGLTPEDLEWLEKNTPEKPTSE